LKCGHTTVSLGRSISIRGRNKVSRENNRLQLQVA
jgi:hypothetical protein